LAGRTKPRAKGPNQVGRFVIFFCWELGGGGRWEWRCGDTGQSIGFRCSSVTNTSVGKGRWAVCVVLCAWGGVAFAAPVAKTRASELAAHELIHVHTTALLLGRGAYGPRPFARRCRPPRRGLAPASRMATTNHHPWAAPKAAKLTGVIRLGEPAPAPPQSCSALYWWCSAHWIPNCQFGNPLTSTPPAP
jgi:hypothetical protein